MNRIFRLTFIFMLLSSFFSCTKNNNETVTGGTITANINGSSYQSASVSEQAVISGTYVSYQFASLNGTKAAGISLFLDSIGVGTFAYDTGFSNALQYTAGNSTYGTRAGSKGSIIITSTGSGTNAITGTFNGTVYLSGSYSDSLVITNGVFTNCAY